MTLRKPAPCRPSAHLIVGEDSYLRICRREEIIAAHVPESARAFAVAQFSLARTPLGQVLGQGAMRPMLSPRQVLVLSELDGVVEEEWAYLEEYFAAPVDFTVLVFEAEKIDRRTRGARLLLEHCEVHLADSPTDSQAVAAAERFARDLGVKLEPQAAEELIFALGTDQGRLRMEVEKLRVHVGAGSEVRTADVAALVSPARQFGIFELVDLLAEGRRADALLRLRQLVEWGESPVGVVGLLTWFYRQLLTAQGLPRGTPTWKAAQVLRAPRSRVEQLVRQARKWPSERLREAFAALLEADLTLKSSPPNPTAVLEMLVARLTMTPA